MAMQKENTSGSGNSPSGKKTTSENVKENHFSLLTDYDIYLLKGGNHYNLHKKLGSHKVEHKGVEGIYFALWAPNASSVGVIGNFNDWTPHRHTMELREDESGIWETFIPGIGEGEAYKYHIVSSSGYRLEKGDPYAFYWETPPKTSSIVWDIDFQWSDQKWMDYRKKEATLNKPIAIYEVHLGSWRTVPEEEGRFLTYREMAGELPAYCRYMGYTHVELMPVMEHPFYGSWGYQITGYFAPSSRFGTPQDFMYLVNELHREGIGVILDWVPSHFPNDKHGLAFFDGTYLFEHQDPRQGFHPDWKSAIFNFGRNEVRAFLISNALYWLDYYHIDGLRVDAVASMLYLDYSREAGEWVPNRYGGRENLEAISFLKEFNEAVHENYPEVITVAEESTAWPGVSHPTVTGGLGFDLKWMMGWMHDTLEFFRQTPVYRSYYQDHLTFSLHYAFSEKYTLPLSHDEVVHGKGSLLNKMPGDEWQQFANLRLLYGYMYGHPGAKLLFMGCEFAQSGEWNHDYSLDWHENNHPHHRGVQELVKDLNSLYQEEPGLYARNFAPEGFQWIDYHDRENSVLSWIRKGAYDDEELYFVGNFTPVPRHNYRIGVPKMGFYREIFNTDNLKYGGSDLLNDALNETAPIPMHDQSHSLSLVLPPLGMIILKFAPEIEGVRV